MIILGIDVSKAKMDCCIFPQGLTGKRKNKVFANSQTGFAELTAWLRKLQVQLEQTTTVMEATSVYHENLAYYLHGIGIRACVANPARVRAFAKGMSMLNKTDKADSEALIRYGYSAELVIWQPEPENIRLLKALLDRREVYCRKIIDLKRRIPLVLLLL